MFITIIKGNKRREHSDEEQKLKIPDLDKINIQDLHVFFISYRDIEAATPDKDRGLASFLMDSDFIYLLVIPTR